MTSIITRYDGYSNNTLLNPITTPQRNPSQSRNGAAQLDTEGRRSRFRSPPPPPGASPSLLIPTPGRYASNASGFASHLAASEPFNDVIPPPKQPIFQLADEQLQDHIDDARYDLPADDVSKGKTIRLHNWSIRLVPVREPISINERMEDLTHWIVICGTRYRSEEINQVYLLDYSKEEGELWHSSFIYWRERSDLFHTRSGSLYELVGPCNVESTCRKKKLSVGFVEKFREGLPGDWVEILVKEAHLRGYVKGSHKVQERNIRELQREAVNGSPEKVKGSSIKLDRRRSRDRGQEYCHLGSTTSGTPSPVPGMSELDLPRRKGRNSSRSKASDTESKQTSKVIVKQLSKPQRRISRELQQLQSSKLGTLSLVQAAILEGLGSTKLHQKNGDTKTKDSDTKIIDRRESTPCATPKKLQMIDTTPSRTSSRTRNGTSEWWKVPTSTLKKSVKKEIIIMPLKGAMTNRNPTPSPAKTLGHITDYSDAGATEDEYHCTSSSEDEKPIAEKPTLSRRPSKAKTRKRESSPVAKEKRRRKDAVQEQEPQVIEAENYAETLTTIHPPLLASVDESSCLSENQSSETQVQGELIFEKANNEAPALEMSLLQQDQHSEICPALSDERTYQGSSFTSEEAHDSEGREDDKQPEHHMNLVSESSQIEEKDENMMDAIAESIQGSVEQLEDIQMQQDEQHIRASPDIVESLTVLQVDAKIEQEERDAFFEEKEEAAVEFHPIDEAVEEDEDDDDDTNGFYYFSD